MKHRIVTAAQMKEIERAGDAHGLPYLQMMENAGLAAYAELQKQFPHPCLLYTSPSPRDYRTSRMPSSA